MSFDNPHYQLLHDAPIETVAGLMAVLAGLDPAARVSALPVSAMRTEPVYVYRKRDGSIELLGE